MKHNFRLSLFTMAMLALSSTAQAQQISMEDAQTIAQQWLTRGEKNSNVIPLALISCIRASSSMHLIP